jgi:serine protease AprX
VTSQFSLGSPTFGTTVFQDPPTERQIEPLFQAAPERPISVILRLNLRFERSVYHADADDGVQNRVHAWLNESRHALDFPRDVRVRHLIAFPEIETSALWQFDPMETPRSVAVVEASPRALLRVLAAEVVQSFEFDTTYETSLNTVGATISATTARNSGYKGAGIKIAVIDTGIDVNHPGFAGRIAAQENFTTEGSPSIVSDLNGHGTHVAGIIAGNGQPSGTFAGIAPEASLFVLKAFRSDGRGSAGDIAAAVSRAIELGADIINFSGGFSPWSPPLRSIRPPWAWSVSPTFEELTFLAAMAQGVLPVVSAGNSGDLNPARSTITRPGRLELVLTVGSVDATGAALSSFSSQGPAHVDTTLGTGRVVTRGTGPGFDVDKPDVVAPGGEVDRTALAGTCPHQQGVMSARATNVGTPWTVCQHPNEPYAFSSGTSMATAAVSGLTALVLDFCDQHALGLRGRLDRGPILKSMLMRSATDLGLARTEQGAGLVTWTGIQNILDDISNARDFFDNYAPIP